MQVNGSQFMLIATATHCKQDMYSSKYTGFTLGNVLKVVHSTSCMSSTMVQLGYQDLLSRLQLKGGFDLKRRLIKVVDGLKL